MRRGRFITAISAAALAAVTFAAAGALAATPMDICRDFQDNGRLDGSYSQAELAAYFQDTTVQGYCGPLTTQVVPGTVAPSTAPVSTPTGKQVVNARPNSGTLGAQKTVTKKPAGAAAPTAGAPLPAAQTSGTLPFTGAQLAIFAIVGLALVAGGLLLRLTGRNRSQV